MKQILAQINAGHPAFSTDDSFIEDVDYTFSSFIAKSYVDKVFEEIQQYGFNLWFDNNLKLHAISANSALTYDVDWDDDIKLKNKENLTFQRENRPVGQIVVVAENVLSTNYTTETITANGSFDQKFEIAEKPGNPNLISIDFDKPAPEELNPASIAGGDTIENGRLKINKVIGQTFSSHYRNYKTSLDARGGLIVGTSLSLNQSSGQCALLALQENPTDSVGDYIAAFFIDGLSLKIIFRGQIIDPGFTLIPSLKQTVLGISGNQVTVDAMGDDYQIGESVIFDIEGETVDVAVVTDKAGNLVTIDKNVTYVTGMKLRQQADYLIKYIYYPDSVIFYAKKGTDANFRVLSEEYLKLTDYKFVQVYANQLHDLSLDWIDLTENLAIQVTRHKSPYPSPTRRPLDVGFEDSASRLQAEVQVYQDSTTEKWGLKFPALENEDESIFDEIYIVTNVISTTTFELDFTTGISPGTRLLLNKTERFVQSVNGNQITLTQPISGITNTTPVYRTEVFPAKDDVLEVVYLASKKEKLPICPAGCLASEGKATKIINIDNDGDNGLTCNEFRLRAETEKDNVCIPELVGSFTFLIEHERRTFNGQMGIYSDIPYAGQIIKIKSKLKNDVSDYKGKITAVNIKSTGNTNITEIEVQIGTPLNSLARFLDLLNKRVRRQSILIDDDIPDESFLCPTQESLFFTDNINAFTSKAGYGFKNGLHKVMVSGVKKLTYDDYNFALSNASKKNAKSGNFKVFVGGLA